MTATIIDANRSTPLRLLRARAAQHDGGPLLRYRDAATAVRDVGAAELFERAIRWAHALRALGAGRDDRVAILLPNSEDYVILWFALPLAGMVEIPINVEQRGPVLKHILEDSAPRLIVVAPEFCQHLVAADISGDAMVIEFNESTRCQFDETPVPRTSAELCDPNASDLSTVMYTSGTTGVSKGVMLSHGYMASLGRNITSMRPDLGATDVFYLCSPMFHVDARCMLSSALEVGGCFAFARRFSARSFWHDVVDLDATFFLFIGAMLSILAKTTNVEMARGHRLVAGTGAPIPAEAYSFFEDELGIRLIEVYGMTEAAAVTWAMPDKYKRGSAGWAAGPFEVRVMDSDGNLLPPGEIGEIVIRPNGPDLVTLGYWHRDDVTAQTFRNLWLHSGDLGKFDVDGFLWFVGREKDMIRRRGENISAFEVESTMEGMPDIAECAALAMADELGGEEEILLLVVHVLGVEPDIAAIIAFASANLARFAMPRWIDFVSELPHTPTGKLAKHLIDPKPSQFAIDIRAMIGVNR